MVDPFVFLAPIVLLGIILLLRFVGCSFQPTAPARGAPGTLTATAGNGQVLLAWESGGPDVSYQITRDNNPLALVTGMSYPDEAVMNGTTYCYTVTTMYGNMPQGTSNSACATPAALPGRPPGSRLNTNNALAQNLIGLFLMNDSMGAAEGQPADDTNLVDGSPASHSGAVAPTWEVMDPSIVFHGGASLTSYLDAAVHAAFDNMPTSQITIVAKLFFPTFFAGGICEKNDSNQGSRDSGFLFGVTNNGALRFIVELSITNMKIQTTDHVVPANQWVQVAFTWDGTQTTGPASAAAIFLKGALEPNASQTNGNGVLDGSKASNSQPFRMGNATYDTIAGSFYGKMAYMAIYKGRLLTPSEMMALDANLPIVSG
jgi:hypothetical protein